MVIRAVPGAFVRASLSSVALLTGTDQKVHFRLNLAWHVWCLPAGMAHIRFKYNSKADTFNFDARYLLEHLIFWKTRKTIYRKMHKNTKKRHMTPLDDLFENHMTLPYVVYQLWYSITDKYTVIPIILVTRKQQANHNTSIEKSAKYVLIICIIYKQPRLEKIYSQYN